MKLVRGLSLVTALAAFAHAGMAFATAGTFIIPGSACKTIDVSGNEKVGKYWFCGLSSTGGNYSFCPIPNETVNATNQYFYVSGNAALGSGGCQLLVGNVVLKNTLDHGPNSGLSWTGYAAHYSVVNSSLNASLMSWDFTTPSGYPAKVNSPNLTFVVECSMSASSVIQEVHTVHQ